MTGHAVIRRTRILSGATVATVTILATSATACAHSRTSQTPHMWQLRGAVLAVHESTVSVRHKSGQVVELSVDKETVYSRGHEPASLEQVTVGSRVRVDVLRVAGMDRAVVVRVF